MLAIKSSAVIIWTTLLIALDQGIKVIINASHLDAHIPILPPVVYFQPVFNRDYSWVNSLFKLGLGKGLHIAVVLVLLFVMYLVYRYIAYEGHNTQLVVLSFAFIFAGGLCSLIDKVFWNGSLDYILLNNWFTFDLKDVYINVFVGVVVAMMVFNYRGFREMDDTKAIRGLWAFVRGSIFGRAE